MSRLLSLGALRLSKLPLTAFLAGLSTALSVEHVIPPPEAASIVANELLVVQIVVFSTSPEGEEVMQAPGELVARVGINSLEQARDNPQIHGKDVQVTGDGAPEDRAGDGTQAKHHDLNRASVFGGESKGGAVGVVDLVNISVQEGGFMHEAMRPVVPGILQHEEDGDLVGHGPYAGKRNRCAKTEELRHGVEEPDLREFDGEVGQEHKQCAFPLLCCGWDFVLQICLSVLVRGSGEGKKKLRDNEADRKEGDMHTF